MAKITKKDSTEIRATDDRSDICALDSTRDDAGDYSDQDPPDKRDSPADASLAAPAEVFTGAPTHRPAASGRQVTRIDSIEAVAVEIR